MTHAVYPGRRVMQIWAGELRDVGSEEVFMDWYWRWYPGAAFTSSETHFILVDVELDTSNI